MEPTQETVYICCCSRARRERLKDVESQTILSQTQMAEMCLKGFNVCVAGFQPCFDSVLPATVLLLPLEVEKFILHTKTIYFLLLVYRLTVKTALSLRRNLQYVLCTYL